jgi:glycosyltransferase involved in cell wall biosynthesis
MRILHADLGGWRGAVDGITAAEDALARLLADAGHEVIRADQSRGDATALGPALRAALQARRTAVDVVHLHSLFRPAHCLLGLLLRIWGIPYVISPHAALAPAALERSRLRKRAFLALFDRALLRGAAAVICLTPREAADVRRLFPGVRTWVVPNPLACPSAARWTQPERCRPLLVGLSRHDVYHKGLDYLVDLASELVEADVVVHGMPDHNEPELVGALVRSAPSNFHLGDPVVGPDKDELLASASLYIQASRWEGLSMALIEALSAGVPMAVSPPVAETVPIAQHGLGIVMSPDPGLAADQIRALLADPARQRTISRAQRRWVAEALGPGRVRQLLEQAYRDAVAQSAGT